MKVKKRNEKLNERKKERDRREREKRRIEVERKMQEAKRINELNRVNLEYNIDHTRSENGSKEREGHTEEIVLPENWATAKDNEGNIYYYHQITRETSWDQPKLTEHDRQEKENKLKRHLERFIGELLLSYRSSEAQVGRITKDDDYRHLIKRLAYGLLKRVVGELKTYRMSEKARNMASKYCHKYMLRQGPVYVRKQPMTSTSSNLSTLPVSKE